MCIGSWLAGCAGGSHARALEATAAWQWWNFDVSKVPPNKTPLRMNWDETAICLFQGGRRGSVFLAKGEPTVQNASRGKQRSYLTHVAFICDDAGVQAVLPQILVGNKRTLPARQLAALTARLPPRVHLLREKSAWVTAELCVKIVGLLGAAVAPYLDRCQPIMLLDGLQQHIHRTVLSACVAARIWPIVVPAKMTWLLQPLDTHAFLRYKAHLQRVHQAASARAPDGVVSLGGFVDCIYTAIREVLDVGRWASAFDADGFGIGQGGVSCRVRAQLQLEAPLAINSERPTLVQLQSCFPKRAAVPTLTIWSPFDPPVARGAAVTIPTGGWAGASMPPAAAVGLRRSARLAAAARVAVATARAGDMSSAASSSAAPAAAAMPKAGAHGPPPKASMTVGTARRRVRPP